MWIVCIDEMMTLVYEGDVTNSWIYCKLLRCTTITIIFFIPLFPVFCIGEKRQKGKSR
jgi:hypothetical protein